MSTEENDWPSVAWLIGLAGFCILLGLSLGVRLYGDMVGDLKKEAISHGAAEYVLVNGGPETKFVWKESKP